MKTQSIKYRLSNETLQIISKKVKLTPDEMKCTPLSELDKVLLERGVIKKKNPVIESLKKCYIAIGEKFKFIEKRYYSFFDGD